MPLFVCSICHCVDNTATSNYWLDVGGLHRAKRPPRCAQCDPEIGQWHDKFQRMDYQDWLRKFPNSGELLNRPDERGSN